MRGAFQGKCGGYRAYDGESGTETGHAAQTRFPFPPFLRRRFGLA